MKMFDRGRLLALAAVVLAVSAATHGVQAGDADAMNADALAAPSGAAAAAVEPAAAPAATAPANTTSSLPPAAVLRPLRKP
jgi:hypothetical protein